MKANNRAMKGVGQDDTAVSPVIAVILMVAITVVLAATVYVWVSGFSDTSDQAPSASFKVMSCSPDSTATNTANDQVIIKLVSGGPLQKDDLKLVVYQTSDSTQVGSTDPLAGSGSWSVGSAETLTNAVMSWTNNGVETDTEYGLDIIHKPSQQIVATLKFVC